MSRLGDVLVDIKPGFASRDDLDDGVFQFRMHNFTRESALDLTKRRRVNATSRQLEAQSVAAGDVLFNSTNSPELVGKSAIVGHLDEPAVFSNHFMRLRTDPERLDAGYLAHFLRHQFARGVFRAMAKAWVNQATVARDRLEDLEIPVPSLTEQRRIAAILDHADALRAKRRQILAHLDCLRQSIFHDFFSAGPIALRPLAQVAEKVVVGHVGPTSSYFRDSGVPFLRTGNIGNGEVTREGLAYVTPEFHASLKKSQLRAGDVLISRVISDEVRTAKLPADLDGANCANVIVVRPGRDLLAEVLIGFLAQPATQRQLLGRRVGSAQSVVNTTVLKELPVPIYTPQDQKSLMERLAAARDQRIAVRSALATHDQLFSSLQSRAFRGEL